jgi:hypothetical protein
VSYTLVSTGVFLFKAIKSADEGTNGFFYLLCIDWLSGFALLLWRITTVFLMPPSAASPGLPVP